MSGESSLPVYTSLRELAGRYDRKSLVALALLVSVQVLIGTLYPEHVRANIWMSKDKLVAGIWIAMTVLLAWDIRPRRDLMLVLVGFVGGFGIEFWGTTTNLWWYRTHERPPAWILHAWPIAALAIDRLGRIFTAVLPPRLKGESAYWTVFPVFALTMLIFVLPTLRIYTTWIALAGIAFVIWWRPMPGRDLCIFFGGSLLGVFIERWSTTRHCWVYYTLQTPPPAPVLAHGFASVMFSRGVQLLELAVAPLEDRLAGKARPGTEAGDQSSKSK